MNIPLKFLFAIGCLIFFFCPPEQKAQVLEKKKTAEQQRTAITKDNPRPEEGDRAPVFKGKDQNGNTVTLSDLLEEGPVVLVFYRGQWCPYCNQHLSKLQDSLNMIQEQGASVIAVSPEKPVHIDQTIEKTEAQFPILYDERYRIMKEYGVDFRVNPQTVDKLEKHGTDLSRAHGDDSNILPVPATYVIGQDRRIDYVHFDRNYKERSTVEEILAHLNQ